jgi:polyferredoxin
MQRLRVLFRILFIYHPTARLDLFTSFPIIRKFFGNRNNLAVVRTFGDIAFTCLILLGLFGPQDPGQNISLFLAWGFWWSGVVLSWFFVGKFWCGVCPFLGMGKLLQHLGISLNLDPPHALRKYFIHISVFFFAAIIWAESVMDMKHWPLGTALLLLAILLGATLMSVFYKGQAWCRYICPLGKIIGAGATMSIIELRSNPNQCRTCRSFACKKGRDKLQGCPIYLGAHNVKNSQDCLICGRCVLLCDNESPRLLLRNPFVELVSDKGRDRTYSLIIPFLAGSQWARYILESPLYIGVESKFLNGSGGSFSLLLVLCFVVFLCIIQLGNRLIIHSCNDKTDHNLPMIHVLLPLAFSGELIYRLKYLLSEAGQFPTVFGRQFGIDFERFSFTVPSHTLTIVSMTILSLGILGSVYVTRLYKEIILKESPIHMSFRVMQTMVGLVALVYLLLIL